MVQFELLLTCYIMLTGFVCSGVIGSFWQLWRVEPIGFSIEYKSWVGGFAGVLFCAFAGPFIIMRNTIRGRRIEHRPIGWVVGASAIASLWSFCTGLLLLHAVLSLRDQISLMI